MNCNGWNRNNEIALFLVFVFCRVVIFSFFENKSTTIFEFSICERRKTEKNNTARVEKVESACKNEEEHSHHDVTMEQQQQHTTTTRYYQYVPGTLSSTNK